MNPFQDSLSDQFQQQQELIKVRQENIDIDGSTNQTFAQMKLNEEEHEHTYEVKGMCRQLISPSRSPNQFQNSFYSPNSFYCPCHSQPHKHKEEHSQFQLCMHSIDKKQDFDEDTPIKQNRLLDSVVKYNTTAAKKKTVESRKDKETPDRSSKNCKGLKNLSQSVYRITQQLTITTYKQVANKLIDELNEKKKRGEITEIITSKDEHNIKRRVYDALNVLIATGILRKEGKNVMIRPLKKSSNKNILSLKEEKQKLEAQYNKKVLKIKSKMTKLAIMEEKRNIIRCIMRRNIAREENKTSEDILRFPLIGAVYIEGSIVDSTHTEAEPISYWLNRSSRVKELKFQNEQKYKAQKEEKTQKSKLKEESKTQKKEEIVKKEEEYQAKHQEEKEAKIQRIEVTFSKKIDIMGDIDLLLQIDRERVQMDAYLGKQ